MDKRRRPVSLRDVPLDPDGCLGWLEVDQRLRRAIAARDLARRVGSGRLAQSTPATASTRRIRSAA
jgi:hypothetical protein